MCIRDSTPARSNGRWPATGWRKARPKVADPPSPSPSPTVTDGRPAAGQQRAEPPPGAGLVPAYEQLRAAALSGQGGVFTHGLAVLARGGVAAWTRVLLEHTPVAERPGRRPAGPFGHGCVFE